MGKILHRHSRIHSVPPVKIQIDPLKSPPQNYQYPINKEDLQGTRSIIQDYKAHRLIIPCTNP